MAVSNSFLISSDFLARAGTIKQKSIVIMDTRVFTVATRGLLKILPRVIPILAP